MKHELGYSYGRTKSAERKGVTSSVSYKASVGYVVAALMLFGAVAGALCANMVESGSHEAIKSYFAGFFGTFDKNAINQKATLIDSFYKYARVIAAVWVSGFFSPGVIIASGIVLFKSFAYGFTTAALVKYFGFYGFVVGFCSYVPQNIFFLPAMYYTANSALFSILRKMAGRDFNGLKDSQNITEYIFILFTGLLCCGVAALTETYLTPSFIEYVMPL